MLAGMKPESGLPRACEGLRTCPLIVEPRTPMAKPQQPEPGYRVLVNVEVFVQSEFSHNGIVTDASVDGSVLVVNMLEGKFAGSEIRVKGIDVVARQPRHDHAQKHGLVKLLDGPSKEAVGWIHRIAARAGGSSVAYVKLSTGEVGIFDLELVAIAHAPLVIRSVSTQNHSVWSLV